MTTLGKRSSSTQSHKTAQPAATSRDQHKTSTKQGNQQRPAQNQHKTAKPAETRRPAKTSQDQLQTAQKYTECNETARDHSKITLNRKNEATRNDAQRSETSRDQSNCLQNHAKRSETTRRPAPNHRRNHTKRSETSKDHSKTLKTMQNERRQPGDQQRNQQVSIKRHLLDRILGFVV